MTALAVLQGPMQTAEAPPAPDPEPEIRMVISEELARTILYFDFDQSQITDASATKIEGFVEQMKSLQDVVVFVESHADRAGPYGCNIDLSERRAEQVRQQLIREGIAVGDLEELKTAAKGEEAPAVQTPDGVPERANRRVEIIAHGIYVEQVSSTGQ